jgi:hypothetical protein
VNESATHSNSKRKHKGVRGLLGYPSRILTNKEERGAIAQARQGQLSKRISCVRIKQEKLRLVKSPKRDFDTVLRVKGPRSQKNKGVECKIRRGTGARRATANQCGQGERGEAGPGRRCVCSGGWLFNNRPTADR